MEDASKAVALTPGEMLVRKCAALAIYSATSVQSHTSALDQLRSSAVDAVRYYAAVAGISAEVGASMIWSSRAPGMLLAINNIDRFPEMTVIFKKVYDGYGCLVFDADEHGNLAAIRRPFDRGFNFQNDGIRAAAIDIRTTFAENVTSYRTRAPLACCMLVIRFSDLI